MQDLNNLFDALCRCLAERLNSGECTAADMAVARQFLKDNGINADFTSPQEPETPEADFLSSLPFTVEKS